MLLVGWTTVATRSDADRIATQIVAARLVACAQIDGPITSHYFWEGRQESAEEYRLTFKFLPAHANAVHTWMLGHHPYTTPEWIVVRAEDVTEKYLSWARSNCTSAPL